MSAAATTKLTALPRSPSLPTFFDNLDSFADSPEGVAKLRELILNLAVRGKLVEQDENDEPASELLERVEAEKARLVQAGSLKKSRPPSRIDDAHSNGVPSGWSAVWLGSCIELISGQHLKPRFVKRGHSTFRTKVECPFFEFWDRKSSRSHGCV